MKALIKAFFSNEKSKGSIKNDFSDFFIGSSASKKKKVLKSVVKKSNADQKKILEKYESVKLRFKRT